MSESVARKAGNVWHSLAALGRPEVGRGASTPGMPKHIGHYRLDTLIGAGAGGNIFRAVDERDGHLVALKVLDLAEYVPSGAAENGGSALAVEAALIRRLAHPNIVCLEEAGDAEGIGYLAMELIAGSNLAQQLRSDGSLGWAQAAMIGVQVGQALAHAHDASVVHGDIKPANIVYDPIRGIAKVLDFGVAAWTRACAGGFAGTPTYMAPELLAGQAPTPASDIYALGATIFELVSGQPPFSGDSVAELMYKISHDAAPAVATRGSELPEAMAQAIDRCLAKSPQARYPSAAALVHTMTTFAAG